MTEIKDKFCPYCCSAHYPDHPCDCSPLEVELRELLPDDMYDSKDWRSADSKGRITWLITMLANKNEEIDMWVDMINHNNDLRKGN